jgi:hypothetical protein
MSDVWRDFSSKLKSFQEHWSVWWSILGGALLYLLGYLVIRFQLTLLGVPANLDVVEERYFFAGARFVVYLIASFSNFLLLMVPVALVIWLCHRWFPPGSVRRAKLQTACALWFTPFRLRLLGALFSIVAIQFVLRQCFVMNNLLLAPALPDTPWLNAILLGQKDPDLFFALLLGTCFLSLVFLLVSRAAAPVQGYLHRTVEVVFVILVISQWLLLPINYSCLIAHKTLPRVNGIGQQSLDNRLAWLVWENNGFSTFLLADSTNLLHGRELLTLPTSDIKTLRITRYDPIFRLLFLQPSKSTNSLEL